jgi:hypothetical protein
MLDWAVPAVDSGQGSRRGKCSPKRREGTNKCCTTTNHRRPVNHTHAAGATLLDGSFRIALLLLILVITTTTTIKALSILYSVRPFSSSPSAAQSIDSGNNNSIEEHHCDHITFRPIAI